MAYNFKNLNEVERQDKPTENTTVMAFEIGNPRQIPASEFGGKGLVVDLRGYTVTDSGILVEDMSYDPIYEAIMAGNNVVLIFNNKFNDTVQIETYGYVASCGIIPSSLGAPITGFVAVVYTAVGHFSFVFTNGSYHATEAASE